MKNVLKLLVQSVLILLGSTAEASSVTDVDIQKKTFGWGMTTLVIWNKEMKDMKIVTSVEECKFAS